VARRNHRVLAKQNRARFLVCAQFQSLESSVGFLAQRNEGLQAFGFTPLTDLCAGSNEDNYLASTGVDTPVAIFPISAVCEPLTGELKNPSVCEPARRLRSEKNFASAIGFSKSYSVGVNRP
jgi:hypothetical protein